MRQFLRWEYLLCKRFFRRKSFLVLLLLLPLMGLLIRAGSREKSGILEIGIVAEEKEGKSSPLAASIAENLLQSESVLHYRSVKSESAARDLLRAGKLDAAWILPADLEARVERMTAGRIVPSSNCPARTYTVRFFRRFPMRFTAVFSRRTLRATRTIPRLRRKLRRAMRRFKSTAI